MLKVLSDCHLEDSFTFDENTCAETPAMVKGE